MKLVVLICGILLCSFSYEGYSLEVKEPHKVNILTWLGYLNYPKIVPETEKACNVKISFDEYYSNDEFLRRWQSDKENYDVIIFADTIYNIVKNDLPKYNSSDLWKNALNYNTIIKKHYFNKRYPHNLIYFFQSLTGILWNPELVFINSSDTIDSMFEKANNNYVVMMDDPLEPFKLTELLSHDLNDKKISASEFNIDNFKKIIRNTHVVIANNYVQTYFNPKFAFAFNWSGDLIHIMMTSKKDYRFFIYSKLSYISSDLVAQTKNNKYALCVAKFLSSKKATSYLQYKTFYFSPYAAINDNNQNKIFNKIYHEYINHLSSLMWLDDMSKKDFEKINQEWQLIKISINEQNSK